MRGTIHFLFLFISAQPLRGAWNRSSKCGSISCAPGTTETPKAPAGRKQPPGCLSHKSAGQLICATFRLAVRLSCMDVANQSSTITLRSPFHTLSSSTFFAERAKAQRRSPNSTLPTTLTKNSHFQKNKTPDSFEPGVGNALKAPWPNDQYKLRRVRHHEISCTLRPGRFQKVQINLDIFETQV